MSAAYAALRRVALGSRRHRRGLLAGAVLGAGAVAAGVALLSLSGYLISRAAEQPPILTLTAAIVGVRALALTRALLRYGERLVSHDLAFRALADLRVRFFRRLVPLVPGGLDGLRRGDLLARFASDVDGLQNLFLRGFAPVAIAALTIPAVTVAAWIMEPAAAPVVAVGLLLAAVAVPAITAGVARAAGRRQAAARAELSADLVEVVSGAPELAVAGREDDWIGRAAVADRRLARLQTRDALAGSVATGLGTALAGITAAAVAFVAVPAVDRGTLGATMLAALVLLALAAFEGVAPVSDAARQLEATAQAAGRLEAVADTPQPVADPAHPRPLPPGELRAEGVSVRYGWDDPWILQNADLRLAPGRAVAVVGPSGAGKSTLAELLVRFRDPDAGRVTIGGVDVRQAAQAEVRDRVRLGGQDSHLFATTIRNNLALARPEADDAALTAALRRVGLGDWLDGLEHDLDTEVGEHGAQVSGGQRQRIAAARLLVCDAPFLVFDEPVAHLDPNGARELLGELAAVARRDGRGVLVISHVADGLDAFDEICTLQEGRLQAVR